MNFSNTKELTELLRTLDTCISFCIFLRAFRKTRSSGPICRVVQQRSRFYLGRSIRRGDGAYLTCKMPEHMLTLKLCKKEGNDQESIQSSITSDTGRNISTCNNNNPVRIECTVHVYILHMSNVGIW